MPYVVKYNDIGAAYVDAETLNEAVLKVESTIKNEIKEINMATFKEANEASRGSKEKIVGSKTINSPDYWTLREHLESAPDSANALEIFEKIIFEADCTIGRYANENYQLRRRLPSPDNYNRHHDLGLRQEDSRLRRNLP